MDLDSIQGSYLPTEEMEFQAISMNDPNLSFEQSAYGNLLPEVNVSGGNLSPEQEIKNRPAGEWSEAAVRLYKLQEAARYKEASEFESQLKYGGDPFLENPLNQFVYGDNIPMAQNGVETNSDTDIQKLVYVQQLLQTQYQQMLETVKANPEILENNEERVIFEQNLSQLQADMEIVDAQLGELQSSQISESQRIPLSDTTTSTATDSTGYDMTKGLDAIWNASDLSRFIAQSEGVSSPAYQYGGSLPKFEEGGPSRVCTVGPNGEITCPDDSHQYHDSVIEGDAAHQQFEDMINKPAFSGIKDKWMEAYIKNACASQGQTNSSGRSLEWVLE